MATKSKLQNYCFGSASDKLATNYLFLLFANSSISYIQIKIQFQYVMQFFGLSVKMACCNSARQPIVKIYCLSHMPMHRTTFEMAHQMLMKWKEASGGNKQHLSRTHLIRVLTKLKCVSAATFLKFGESDHYWK